MADRLFGVDELEKAFPFAKGEGPFEQRRGALFLPDFRQHRNESELFGKEGVNLLSVRVADGPQHDRLGMYEHQKRLYPLFLKRAIDFRCVLR